MEGEGHVMGACNTDKTLALLTKTSPRLLAPSLPFTATKVPIKCSLWKGCELKSCFLIETNRTCLRLAFSPNPWTNIHSLSSLFLWHNCFLLLTSPLPPPQPSRGAGIWRRACQSLNVASSFLPTTGLWRHRPEGANPQGWAHYVLATVLET